VENLKEEQSSGRDSRLEIGDREFHGQGVLVTAHAWWLHMVAKNSD